MKIFGWKITRLPHNLTSVDRDKGRETQELERELKAKKAELEYEIFKVKKEVELEEMKQKLDELRGVYEYDDEEPQKDPMDQMWQTLLMGFLMKQGQQPGSAPIQTSGSQHTVVPKANSTTPEPGVSFTDQQLQDMWSMVPRKYRKMAQTSTDDQVKALIRGQLPDISSVSLNRALEIVRQ